MTEHLVDLASYQDGIDLAKVKAAGFSKVNVKLSQGNWYQWSKASQYIASAKTLGLDICTFHWLDNTASGGEQARVVLAQMRQYGILTGTAHQCDCEDATKPATFAIWRDYVNAMQDGLGRNIANYTGDWWWQPRGWTGANLTPYLWAGPNNGYLTSYPGDTSSHWRAGYGGWGDYSLLQYAVQPVSGVGGGNLSKTAIRDPKVWAALTGKKVADVALKDDPDGQWMFPRIEALAKLQKPSSGPEKGADLAIVKWAREVEDMLRDLTSRTPSAFTDAQVAALADKIGGVLIDRTDNPLGPADQPAIVQAVKQALREGAGGA